MAAASTSAAAGGRGRRTAPARARRGGGPPACRSSRRGSRRGRARRRSRRARRPPTRAPAASPARAGRQRPTSGASSSVADPLVLAARPRRHLDDGRVGVVEQRRAGRPRVAWPRLDAPAVARRRRGRRTRREQVVVEPAEALERPERGRPHRRVGGVARPRRAVAGVARVPGRGHRPPASVGHCLSRSVSVVTINARRTRSPWR